jgi:hypothetical protein
MVKIIQLLNQKNHLLEKFYTLNERELLNFVKSNFDNLEHFYRSREKILELIKIVDNEIEVAPLLEPHETQYRAEIKEALAIKDEYVNRILAQDLEVLSCIETAKSDIIKELQDIRRAKHAVGSYRSKLPGPSFSEEA